MPVFSNKLNLVDFTKKFFTKNGRVYDFFDNCLLSVRVDGETIKAGTTGSYPVDISSASHGRNFHTSPSVIGNDFPNLEFSRRSISYVSSSNAIKINGITTLEYAGDGSSDRPLAFSFWVKKSSSSTGTIFHAKDPQYDSGAPDESPDILIYTKDDNSIGIEIRRNGLQHAGIRTQHGQLKVGKWHYVVITYDGSVGLTMLGTEPAGDAFSTATGRCTGGAFSIYIDNFKIPEYQADRSVGMSVTMTGRMTGEHREAEIFIGNTHQPGGGYWLNANTATYNASNQTDLGGALSGSLANFNMWVGKTFSDDDASLIYNSEIFGVRKLSSGIPNPPTKIHKAIECNLEDYPPILRSGDNARFGNEDVKFSDNLTIELKDDELINFPTGLPKRLLHDTNFNTAALSPHTNSDIDIAASGTFARIYESAGQNLRKTAVPFTPFNDTKSFDNDNPNVNAGLDPSIYPGFSAKYGSKVKIEIDLTSADSAEQYPIGFSVASDAGENTHALRHVFTPANDSVSARKTSRVMSYWNPSTKDWEPVGQYLHGTDDLFDHDEDPGSGSSMNEPAKVNLGKNWARKFMESAAIGFSPGEGLTLAVTSSLSGSTISDSFEMAARPIDNFGFPHDHRYHAGKSTGNYDVTALGKGGDAGETIKMSKYIQKPFLIEKVEWDVAVSASIAYSSSLMYIEDNPFVTGSSPSFPYRDFGGNSEGIFNFQSPFASSIATFFILKQDKTGFLDQDRFTRQTYLLDGKGRYLKGYQVTSSLPVRQVRCPGKTEDDFYLASALRDVSTTRELVTYSQATFYYSFRDNLSSGEQDYFSGEVFNHPSLYACEKSYGTFLSGSQAENIPVHSGFLKEGLGRETNIPCYPDDASAATGTRRHYYFTGSINMFDDCKITPPIGILDKGHYTRPDNKQYPEAYVPAQENFRGSTYPLILYGFNSAKSDRPVGRPRNTLNSGIPYSHAHADHKNATLAITNLTWGGGRNPTLLSDPRSLVAASSGNKFKNSSIVFNPVAPFRFLGHISEEPDEDLLRFRPMNAPILKPMESYSTPSPYILMPDDELVIGCQMGLPVRMSHLFLSSSGSPSVGKFNRVDSKGGSYMKFAKNQPSKLVLYGSFISDGKQYVESLNQRLTTKCVHEDLKSESWPVDQFQISNLHNLSGSYLDNHITGSMKIVINSEDYEGVRGVSRRYNVSKYSSPGTSPKSMMDSGSLQRHIVLSDSSETYYDSLIPDPRSIWDVDGVGSNEYTQVAAGIGVIGYNFSTDSTLTSTPLQANNLWPSAFPFEHRYENVKRLTSPLPGALKIRDTFKGIHAGAADWTNNTGNGAVIHNFIPIRNEIKNKYRCLFGWWRTSDPQLNQHSSQGRNKWLTGIVHRTDKVVLASIAGYKYGLSNVVPTKTTACFRYDHYGHLRDMLEQRKDTTFYDDSQVNDSPIKIKFIDRSTGLEIDPADTQSQNLSKDASVGAPYTEDNPSNRFYLTSTGDLVRVPPTNDILIPNILIT